MRKIAHFVSVPVYYHDYAFHVPVYYRDYAFHAIHI